MTEKRRKALDALQTKLMNIGDTLAMFAYEESEEQDDLDECEQNYDHLEAIEDALVNVDEAIEHLGIFSKGA